MPRKRISTKKAHISKLSPAEQMENSFKKMPIQISQQFRQDISLLKQQEKKLKINLTKKTSHR